MPPNIERALGHYPAIAWDFDETLHNSEASPILHQFILDHPEIKHVIVTFRSHGWEHRIWDELADYEDAPGREHFAGVLNIDDDTFAKFSHAGYLRSRGELTGEPTEAETTYVEWKGMVCKANNLPVLVDDKTEHVAQGCTRYGVALFDPLVFM